MRALVLAGGLGTRLRPLTYAHPKVLLPIANRPHIEHVFALLGRHGIDHVVLLTSYLADAFTDVIESARARGVTVEVAHEREPLGTAGAFKNAEDLVGDDAFLAFNGDILTDVDLTQVISFHRARGAVATIVLTAVDDPSRYGVVPTDSDGRVRGFIEKPDRDAAPTNLINAGVYVFEPGILTRIPVGRVYSAERDLFPSLVAEGAPLYAMGVDAYWKDIGTPQAYLEANLDALAGRFATDAATTARDGVLAADDAVVAPTAAVTESCLGAGARVDDGAVVTRTVLLPRAHVGAGATVTECVLGEGAAVDEGAQLTGDVVADDASG